METLDARECEASGSWMDDRMMCTGIADVQYTVVASESSYHVDSFEQTSMSDAAVERVVLGREKRIRWPSENDQN